MEFLVMMSLKRGVQMVMFIVNVQWKCRVVNYMQAKIAIPLPLCVRM